MTRVSIEVEAPRVSSEQDRSNSSMWLLLLLLAGSGCAALIYEIVWLQLLQLVIGSSAVSLGLLLAAYMGGLCLGSAALPRLVSSRIHPFRVYACLEVGIAVFGILILFGVPYFTRIWHGTIAAAFLLLPTVLMGAAFPAVARWVKTTPNGLSWLGSLYTANIVGAIAGCLFAGFYLLRVYDMAVATYTAAAINIVIALAAFGLSALVQSPISAEPASSARRSPGALLIYVAITLSGLTALGAEVVWTRLLSLLMGATVYTFSIILAVFLAGLSAGSAFGSFLLRRLRQPRLALAGAQV